ncbi:kinase-like domain, phloem protein 2-like protein, partial [Tanacetum coccineum]
FQEVIELLPQQAFFLKCTIRSQMLSPDTEYVCYLVFKLSETCQGLHYPVKVRDVLHQENNEAEFVYFITPSPLNIHGFTRIPKQRDDGWMEIQVWKFNSAHEFKDDSLSMNFKFTSHEGIMSGLISIELFKSNSVQKLKNPHFDDGDDVAPLDNSQFQLLEYNSTRYPKITKSPKFYYIEDVAPNFSTVDDLGSDEDEEGEFDNDEEKEGERERSTRGDEIGRSRTLVGQGSVVIVTAGAYYLPRMSTKSMMACGSDLPKGLLYLLYAIKSPQSSIFTACDVMLRAVNVTRLRFLRLPALDTFCQNYHIPDNVNPELLGPNQNIHNSPVGKIGVYTRFFDFANFWIPLSRFLVDVLEYFRINLSQLSVIAAARISHFEILCRVYEMDLLAFIRHADPIKVRIGEKRIKEGHVPLLDSTVGHVIPLAGEDDQARSVVRVGHGDQNDNIENVGHDDPNKESGDADQENWSEGNDHVGQDETSTILMDAEVQAAGVGKPKGKRKKRRTTGGASDSNHPPKKLREDHDTSGNVSANTSGKSLAVV